MEKRIGFGLRLGAFVIDSVLVGICSLLLGGTVGAALGSAVGAGIGSQAGDAAGGAIVGAVLGAVLAFIVLGALYGLIEAFTGASPGKMILGIKVGTEDGKAAPVGTYVARYAVKNISSLCSIVSLVLPFIAPIGWLLGLVIFVGCFFVLGEKRQAIHDMVAKTAVYYKKDLAPAAPAHV